MSDIWSHGDSSLNQDRRTSYSLNDDEFDYALELKPDDEYRQAAEALQAVRDFDEEVADDDCND